MVALTRTIILALAAAALSPAANLLVLLKSGNNLAILDPNDYHLIARVPTGNQPHEAAASEDGRLAFTSNYGTAQEPGHTLSVIDIAARKEIHRVDLGPLLRPHGLFVSGGKLYFTAEGSRAIARYDPATNTVDWLMGTGENGSHMLVVTPDGKRIYNVNIGADCVTSTDLATGRMERIPVGKQPEGITVSPDGKEVWVGHDGDGGVSIIDTAANKVTQRIQVGQRPIRVRFTPDGSRVLISDATSGDFTIWDARTRKKMQTIALGGTPVGILVTPDSKRAFVAQTQMNKVAVVDLAQGKVIQTIEPGEVPDGMAWAE